MYDFENGRTQEATRLADEAAAVYSYAGMVTKAKLLERTGQFDAAEALLQTTTTRYDNATDLTAFYLRRLRTAARRQSVSRRHGPREWAAAGRSAHRWRPHYHVGHRGAVAEFAEEDLIVAVDGIRVHNYAQFTLVWRMSPDPEISFLVFHDGKYREIRGGALRDRWLSGSFVSYD